jgi:FkbM family methyltransferase
MIVRAEEVVQAAYNLLLNREPEPAGLKHWSGALASGLSRMEFVRAVMASAEFREQLTAIDPLTKYRDVDLLIPIDGRHFRVPASDLSLVPHLLAHRSWEPHITSYLRRELRPADVVVDAGANLGYFTVMCAPLVARVVAFEPVATNHRYCAANVALGAFDNVEVLRCGLWSDNTTLYVKSEAASVMTAAITHEDNAAALEPIRAVSLDAMIASAELALPRLDVVKMDVEGAEVAALRGMRDTIARLRPRVIMEVNRPALAMLGAGIQDVWDFFQEAAYDVAVFAHWEERDPQPVCTFDELVRLCPADTLIDILATPRA